MLFQFVFARLKFREPRFVLPLLLVETLNPRAQFRLQILQQQLPLFALTPGFVFWPSKTARSSSVIRSRASSSASRVATCSASADRVVVTSRYCDSQLRRTFFDASCCDSRSTRKASSPATRSSSVCCTPAIRALRAAAAPPAPDAGHPVPLAGPQAVPLWSNPNRPLTLRRTATPTRDFPRQTLATVESSSACRGTQLSRAVGKISLRLAVLFRFPLGL